MRIRADFGVGHPAADVWALLAGPEGAACVPGLDLPGSGSGSLAIDVEARHLVFEGEAAVASDERARTVTVEARGVERGGRGKARATLLLRVDEDGMFSTVAVEADLHLSGEIAAESRLVAEEAYRLADRLAGCLEERLGRAASASTVAVPLPKETTDRTVRDDGWLHRLLRRLGAGREKG